MLHCICVLFQFLPHLKMYTWSLHFYPFFLSGIRRKIFINYFSWRKNWIASAVKIIINNFHSWCDSVFTSRKIIDENFPPVSGKIELINSSMQSFLCHQYPFKDRTILWSKPPNNSQDLSVTGSSNRIKFLLEIPLRNIFTKYKT